MAEPSTQCLSSALHRKSVVIRECFGSLSINAVKRFPNFDLLNNPLEFCVSRSLGMCVCERERADPIAQLKMHRSIVQRNASQKR